MIAMRRHLNEVEVVLEHIRRSNSEAVIESCALAEASKLGSPIH